MILSNVSGIISFSYVVEHAEIGLIFISELMYIGEPDRKRYIVFNFLSWKVRPTEEPEVDELIIMS